MNIRKYAFVMKVFQPRRLFGGPTISDEVTSLAIIAITMTVALP